MVCSFCQGFYLTERAWHGEIPDPATYLAEQADGSLGICQAYDFGELLDGNSFGLFGGQFSVFSGPLHGLLPTSLGSECS
jgi:hypothetical protein